MTAHSFLRSALSPASLILVLFAAPPAFAGGEPPAKGDPRWVAKHELVLAAGGFLGVQALEMTPELRRHLGAPEDAGVLIGRVVEDGPAQAAGVAVGDVLTSVNGHSVAHPGELIRRLRSLEKGDVAHLEVWRDGRRLRLSATLEASKGPAVLGLGPGVHFIPDFRFEGMDLEQLPRIEGLEDLGERLGKYFSGPEWEASLEELKRSRGDLGERLQEMEKRLREMEKRLQELDGEERQNP